MNPTVLAFDPGGTTGVASYHSISTAASDGFASLEVPGGFDGAADWLLTYQFTVPDVIVVESFIVNAGTHKKDPGMFRDTTSIIGALRLFAHQRAIPVVFQTPARAKAFGTDDKLRTLGWHIPSPGGHRNDAARHLLTYLASERVYPVLAALTPTNGAGAE